MMLAKERLHRMLPSCEGAPDRRRAVGAQGPQFFPWTDFQQTMWILFGNVIGSSIYVQYCHTFRDTLVSSKHAVDKMPWSIRVCEYMLAFNFCNLQTLFENSAFTDTHRHMLRCLLYTISMYNFLKTIFMQCLCVIACCYSHFCSCLVECDYEAIQ